MDQKSIGQLTDAKPEQQPVPTPQRGGGSAFTPQIKQTTTGQKMGSVGKPIVTSKGC